MAKDPNNVPRIGLLASAISAYGRGILRGIRSYIRQSGRWAFHLYADAPKETLARLVAERYDGIIAQISGYEYTKRIIESGIPAVNVSNALLNSPIPRVVTDDLNVGRTAAEYFLANGFRHFAYCSFSPIHSPERQGFAHLRGEGFLARLAESGFPASVFPSAETYANARAGDHYDRALRDWLSRLPRPSAVFCCNDVRSRHVVAAAETLQLPIPETFSILGVDNDDLECELSTLPLSSVAVNTDRIGYEAASLLQRLMDGQRPPAGPILIPPGRIIVRRSSDILAIEDPEVVAAVRFIRNHAHEPIDVDSVADAVAISRRSLERRFSRILGFAPHTEIRRVRIERAKQLLTETTLSMPEVAHSSGFKDAKLLSMLFRKAVGMPPTSYRTHFRVQVY